MSWGLGCWATMHLILLGRVGWAQGWFGRFGRSQHGQRGRVGGTETAGHEEKGVGGLEAVGLPLVVEELVENGGGLAEQPVIAVGGGGPGVCAALGEAVFEFGVAGFPAPEGVSADAEMASDIEIGVA